MNRLLLLTALATTGAVHALDTTENFDPGFSDLEVYFSTDGLGRLPEESTVAFETFCGMGITGSLGAFVSAAFESDRHLAEPEDALSMGLFLTAVDGDPLSLDFYWSTGTGGAITAGTELNLVSNIAGLQLNTAVTWENRGDAILASTWIQPLFHRSLSDRCEVLAAADVVYDQNAAPDEDEMEFVSVSGGFNYAAFDGIELIGQVDWISPDGDDPCAGFSVGMIATLQ